MKSTRSCGHRLVPDLCWECQAEKDHRVLREKLRRADLRLKEMAELYKKRHRQRDEYADMLVQLVTHKVTPGEALAWAKERVFWKEPSDA